MARRTATRGNFYGARFTQVFDDGPGWDNEQTMDLPIGELFTPGLEIEYEYDFGSTTELVIKVEGMRMGKWQGRPISLMARNQPLEIACLVCGQPATSLCVECTWEMDDWAYCDANIRMDRK